MPRAPHKKGRSVHKRGLSSEKVCVPCAIDLTGTAYAKVSNLARIKITGPHAVLDNKIAENSILVTDKASAYKQFASDNKLDLEQLKACKTVLNGIYSLHGVDAYHSQLKKFLKSFNGVATKYLNNYLIWNITMIYKQDNFQAQKADIMSKALSAIFREHSKDIPNRDSLPVVA